MLQQDNELSYNIFFDPIYFIIGMC